MRKLALIALASTILLSSTSVYAAQHTVKEGETFWTISRSYGISLESMIRANPNV